jgi:hypothetical protein
MNRGNLVLIVGILVLIVSLLADSFGLGRGGFGPKQIGGAVAGAIIAIVGFVMRSKAGKGSAA